MPVSLLYPDGKPGEGKTLGETALHDLGLDVICEKAARSDKEKGMLLRTLARMTGDGRVSAYRIAVFDELFTHPVLCDRLMELLGKIDFLRDYGSFKERFDEHAGIWDLMHRLEEIGDYIGYVEGLEKCLTDAEPQSDGLKNLKSYVDGIYRSQGFGELKKDIAACRATTRTLRSVTLGVNLNERFEASAIGLVSINSKPFTRSGLLGSFNDWMNRAPAQEAEWNENYRFQPFAGDGLAADIERAAMLRFRMNPMTTLAAIPAEDSAENVTYQMNQVANHMLGLVVKKLREVLHRYVNVTITDITDLIPELLFYIRFAEYIRGLEKAGHVFCMPKVTENDRVMAAKGVWNLKLSGMPAKEVVRNDLIFDEAHRVHILTGANRGGKTTITQAVGQLFVLAQGGLRVPGEAFTFAPADCVYTHFPADEDQTLDLGRLGEECSRFRELYGSCTKTSLLLLNETFSTTSFEEGYYIARDAVKALLAAGIRTVYNTHMHKLAYELGEINQVNGDGKAASLIVKAEEGRRSFRVVSAPPEGLSLAHDIAEKYGVTYEMLTGRAELH